MDVAAPDAVGVKTRFNVHEHDPATGASPVLKKGDLVATAGGDFARFAPRLLADAGLTHFVAEPAHWVVGQDLATLYNYGIYSTRCGDIVSSRQLLQWFRRAHQTFAPVENLWRDGDRYIDPFRPHIQANGFASPEEVIADREQHLDRARQMFRWMQAIIVTLGATSTWTHSADGAAYPVKPGEAGGVFDPNVHALVAFRVDDISADLRAFVTEARLVNPAAKFILTVSRGPASTSDEAGRTLSEAARRVAAEGADVHYFPSFELASEATGTPPETLAQTFLARFAPGLNG